MYGIKLCRDSSVSLAKQLYSALINLIQQSVLKEQEHLPSTRELAKELAISRNTVNEAYELLVTEGYVYSKAGVGYIVQKNRAEKQVPKCCTEEKNRHETEYDFSLGIPDIHSFPFLLWNSCQKKTILQCKKEDFAYGDPQGYLPLRQEIAKWLFRSKGLQTEEDNIFITAGTTQAINFCLELLKPLQQTFFIEDPCYYPVAQILQRLNFLSKSIPVDEQGINVSEIKKYKDAICGCYVTPSHQFPKGSVLSDERRTDLVKLAVKRDFYILEDDYDGEFFYEHSELSPLYSLCPERVIYLGTFSKTLFPALRIGFILLPQKFHAQWKALRCIYDRQSAIHDQITLSCFMQERKIDTYIRKMNKVYAKKLQILLDSLKKYFPQELKFLGINAGLHIALQVQGAHFDEKFYQKCLEHKIALSFYPCKFYQKEFIAAQCEQDILYLGYGAIEEAQIENAVKRLASLL